MQDGDIINIDVTVWLNVLVSYSSIAAILICLRPLGGRLRWLSSCDRGCGSDLRVYQHAHRVEVRFPLIPLLLTRVTMGTLPRLSTVGMLTTLLDS